MAETRPPLPLGTETKWGKIGAVGTTGGERYYWMVRKDGRGGSVAMIDAHTVESMHPATTPDSVVPSPPPESGA